MQSGKQFEQAWSAVVAAAQPWFVGMERCWWNLVYCVLNAPHRFNGFSNSTNFASSGFLRWKADPSTVVHLSDEEGLDGDDLYAQLPATCQIWRNFPHPRFRSDSRVSSFPIGPRDLFLGKDDLMAGIPSSKRPFPWAFMGTLWASGSRTVAVSIFLRSLPPGLLLRR